MRMEMVINCYESILFTIFLIGFLGFRGGQRGRVIAGILCSALLFLNIAVSDMSEVYNWYSIVVDLLITFIFYCICLGGSKKDFLITFFLYSIGTYLSSNVVIWGFYMLNQENIEVWLEVNAKYRIVALVLSRAFLTLYLWLVLRYKKRFHFNNRVYYFYFIFFAFMEIFLFSILFPVLLELYEQSPQIGEKVFIVLTCLVILIGIFQTLVMRMSRMAQYKVENDALHNMLQSERSAMERYIKKENEVYKWAHDLKNRILAIRFLAKKDFAQADKALEGLGLELNEKMGALISAENIWESILESKGVEERGIRLVKRIAAGGAHLDAVDIGILFGNLLDNAIEAVEKIQSKDNVIWVDVCLEMNMLGITVMNTVEDGGDGALHLGTSKSDTRRHGYGIQSIRSIVEKYGGTCEFYLEEERFVAEIQLLNDNI